MSSELEVRCGHPEAWRAFLDRHPHFEQTMLGVYEAINAVYKRRLSDVQVPEQVVFMLARLAVSDFLEIHLVCGNGSGSAGRKLLRGMFERVVTVYYLSDHRDEVQNYLDYDRVAERRTYNAFRTHVPDFEAKNAAEIEERYREVKERYLVKACNSCGAKRENFRWHRYDVPTMASKVGLGDFIVPAYTLATTQIHDTVRALKDRMIESENIMRYDDRLQPRVADEVMMVAHGLLLKALIRVAAHFKLDDVAPALQRCGEDFALLWEKPSAPI